MNNKQFSFLTKSFLFLVLLGVLSTAGFAQSERNRAALVTQLDQTAQSLADADAAPGVSVLIVQQGDTLLHRGYGYADVEHQVPALTQTVYRIGSITKQFTAAAILHLVENGKLNLDDTLTKYIAHYPQTGEGVTIHHLLNHTSGIPSYTGIPEFWEKSRLDLSHEEMLDFFKDKPLEFNSGDEWAYNNSGYYLLGMIIEKVTGKTYADYLAETFFEPLNLTTTTYCNDQKLMPHRAEGYDMADGVVVNASQLSMNAPYSAGALCSTVGDLAAWKAALTSGQVVSTSSYAHMVTPTTLNDERMEAYGYGLGVQELEGHPKVAHGGGIHGFVTYLAHYPEDALTIAVLTNSGSGNPNEIEEELARLVLDLPKPVFSEIAVSADVLADYVGVYQVAPTFKVTISLDGGQLKGQATGQGSVDLFPYEADKFFIKVVEAQITFHRGEDGGVVSMTLHQGGRDTSAKKIE